MSFCRNCGSEIAEGGKFCPSCGIPVEAAAAPETRQEEVQAEPQIENKFTEAFNKGTDTTSEYDADDIASNKAMAILGHLDIWGDGF